MKSNKKIFFSVFALLLVISTITSAQKVGSTSMQFLKVMPVARATAMGDAYAVWAKGAEAVFWNPAGLQYTNGNELTMTYVQWIFDTYQGAFAYARSLGMWGSLGLQLQYVDFGTFDEAVWVPPYNQDLNTPGLTGRTFRPYSYLVGISYANALTDKFTTGLTVKYAHESLYNDKEVEVWIYHPDTSKIKVKTWANVVLFDYGIHYKTGYRTIEIAASIQNFGPNVKYGKEDHPAPLSFRIGIAGDLMGPDALLFKSENSRLGMEFDIFHPNDYTQQYHIGAEYEFAQLIALRAGYKLNYDADGFTAGLGIKQTLGTVRFAFDYSFGMLNYHLGNVHRISLGVGF
ncbi:MAG: PorV/PorQ family protein [Bacteroidetes bacterium]|nr:PorV/PorQ family protein [Bacteroidota bacterium]